MRSFSRGYFLKVQTYYIRPSSSSKTLSAHALLCRTAQHEVGFLLEVGAFGFAELVQENPDRETADFIVVLRDSRDGRASILRAWTVIMTSHAQVVFRPMADLLSALPYGGDYAERATVVGAENRSGGRRLASSKAKRSKSQVFDSAIPDVTRGQRFPVAILRSKTQTTSLRATPRQRRRDVDRRALNEPTRSNAAAVAPRSH